MTQFTIFLFSFTLSSDPRLTCLPRLNPLTPDT